MRNERPHYLPPAEGLAVIFQHGEEIAVVRHAQNDNKGIQFGQRDLPRETRERNGEHFEPLTATLDRTMREELGIHNWKEKNIHPVRYVKQDCTRPDGSYIKAHIVVMQSEEPLISLSDPRHIDGREIIAVESVPLVDVLQNQDQDWRSSPDGRDLIRSAFQEDRPLAIEAGKEVTLANFAE